jgi:hypothetical protein
MNDQPEIIAKLSLDTKEAESDVKSFGKSLAGIGAALGAVISTAAIVAGLKKSIEAAMEAEQATKAFNASLAQLGQYSKETSQDFQDFATSLQRTTGISDELILKNSALLVSIGRLSGDGLKQATRASLDLAAGLQIDVGTAFDVMTKASQGNITMLSKYGLEVRQGASDSQKFAAALDFVSSRFGGQAESGLKSFSGALTGFSNAIGDVLEEIGKLFTASPTFRALIIEVTKLLINASDSITKFGSSGDVLAPIINGFFTLGQVITTYIIAPLEWVLRTMYTGLLALPNLMTGVFMKLAPIIDSVLGTSVTEKITALHTGIVDLQSSISAPLTGDGQSFADRLSTGLDTLKQKVSETAATVTDEVKNITAAISIPPDPTFFDGFKDGLKDMGSNIATLGKQVSSTFVTGFSNAFASVGKALVEGNNAFGAFGKAILSMLGNVAIQMGQFYIAAGIAALWLNPAQGAGMIAGGAALAVLGGVLQALGGGGAGGGVGATQAGTVAGGGQTVGLDPNDQMAQQDERNAPQTGVTVNIQGNVLDRRQTGLEIAEILNEAFDTDGVTVRAVSGLA